MKKLRILIFEYITGGGFNQLDLPNSLANEGLLMLQALVDNLAEIDKVELVIMLDMRMVEKLTPYSASVHIIEPEQNCQQEFIRLLQTCDAVWPIAPESNLILQTLCEIVERSGKILLTSGATAVNIAGNKWLTYQQLRLHSIATVQTYRLAGYDFSPGEWIIKPMGGVGCEDSYVFSHEQAFDAITATLDKPKYIIQPHIQGEKTSLSCVFKQGQSWLVSVNQQHFNLVKQHYQLVGITVNYKSYTPKYRNVIAAVAKAIPDLWGYVGIDLIETAEQIVVLEINPRLTTSFVGINAALGINCAREVLDLLQGDPRLQPTRNQSIYINIAN